MSDIKCQLDKDFTTVTEWGESCPSLAEITLPREHSLPYFEYLSYQLLIDFGRL